MVLDYSKFDCIGDDDEQLVGQLKLERERQKPENGWSTHYGRGLLSDPLLVGITAEMHVKDDRDTMLTLKDGEMESLLLFLVTQQNGSSTDNTPKAAAIAEFMASGRAPKTSVLLAMMWAVDRRIAKVGRPVEETSPIWGMLLGALNTLLAVAKKGSAEALYTSLDESPESVFAKRYAALEFGRARYDKYKAAAQHEEERWKYGDAIPWRDYAPRKVIDRYDFFWTLPEWQRWLCVGVFGLACLGINPLLVALGIDGGDR